MMSVCALCNEFADPFFVLLSLNICIYVHMNAFVFLDIL